MSDTASLHTIKQEDLEFADPAEDIRGHNVVDRKDQHIGKVDALMVDDVEHKVRFLVVGTGGLLGFHKNTFLIPVDAITAIDEKVVRVDRTGDEVGRGPTYDPKLVNDPEAVLDYYGLYPYWGAEYIYPGYPYY
jgi:sporulation protein YlmC with PRC-barrel domain